MSNFSEIMELDMTAMTSVEEFGETVVYVKGAGATRSIAAIVEREVVPTEDELQRGLKEVMIIRVRNDSTYGISATELDGGKDCIRVAYRIGGTAKDYALGIPLHIDPAELIFRVK